MLRGRRNTLIAAASVASLFLLACGSDAGPSVFNDPAPEDRVPDFQPDPTPPTPPAKKPAPKTDRPPTNPEPYPPAACWDASLDVGPGICSTAHQMINAALHSCFDKQGEPVRFKVDMETGCFGGGFRRAMVECCSAHPNAPAPPESLPEPPGPLRSNNTGGLSCSGGWTGSEPAEHCRAPFSSNIIETVTNFAKMNQEVRQFSASGRCKDGAWANVSLMTCS